GIGILTCLYFTGDVRQGMPRFAWLAPIGLFGYALKLTQSRGGLLGATASLFILGCARYGWKKATVAAAITVPLLLAVAGGRQADFNLDEEDTGQARIQLWGEGFALFKQSPVFGIGAERYREEVGQVAHNSFVHAYVETGLLGGTLFVGMFSCALQ